MSQKDRAATAHGDSPGQADAGSAEESLRRALLAGANATGGWAYYAGKAARLEPTCWAELALGTRTPSHSGEFLSKCQQSTGWLAEDLRWPVNIGFNGLAAFTWLALPDLATDDARRRLLAALSASKGVAAPPSDVSIQNNALQGWSWIDGNFSWVEPTCWGLLALKKARRRGLAGAEAHARIDEADRLLIDRTCSSGGWNYGNANMLHKNLRPFVPTTALGLLALQDRRKEPAVARSLAFLEDHWADEISATSLGLSCICLTVYNRPVNAIAARLREQVDRTRSFANLRGIALALCALAPTAETGLFDV
jgi:hypothetical protein